MSFKINKSIEFDYGHRIASHKSKCFHPHGHRGRVVAYCGATDVIQEGEQSGMVLDFSFLKEILMTKVHDVLDHKFIICIDDTLLLKNFLQEDFVDSRINRMLDRNFYLLTSADGFNLVLVPVPPTAENLAKLIFQEIKEDIALRSDGNAWLLKLEFWETPTSCASFTEAHIVYH